MQQKKKQAKAYKPLLTPKQISNIIHELPEYRQKKAASIEFRKNVIEAQNRDNYLNELPRLEGFISTYTLPQLQEDRINNRMGSLNTKSNRTYKSRGSLYKDSILRFGK